MLEKLKRMLGVSKKSVYVQDFFSRSNMKSAIYMAIVCIALELWMIYSVTQYVMSTPETEDMEWLISHFGWYVALIAVSVLTLVFASRYLKRKKGNRFTAGVIIRLFSLVSIVFGIHFGYTSFVKGQQILSFITMAVFVFCILTWQPLEAFFYTVAAYGGFYLIANHASPVQYADQVNLFMMWISSFIITLSAYFQKISEGEKSEGLEKLSDEDMLTGIPNMRSFYRNAQEALAEWDDPDHPPAVAFLDLENFKSYNGKFGHRMGDEFLCKIAALFMENLPKGLAARISDDHFVALLNSGKLEEIIWKLREQTRMMTSEVHLDLKTGFFCIRNGESLSVASDRARIACSSIKQKNDRWLCEYDEQLASRHELIQYVINNIDLAIEKGYIRVYYQPVVNCAGEHPGELMGVEVLARWDDPVRGLLSPAAFIGTLEEYRAIDKLDQCIVKQVCQDLRKNLDVGLPVVPCSINFSRLDFELFDVPAFLEAQLEQYQISPQLLDVEITESALSGNLRFLQKNMNALREKGFQSWLDDFGSGYSSLNTLKDFAFDVMKIDMSFLRNFDMNEKSKPILRNMVDLGKQLGMVTLCEGVETKEQFDFLRSIGCQRAQGYYFSKPLPLEQLKESGKWGI